MKNITKILLFDAGFIGIWVWFMYYIEFLKASLALLYRVFVLGLR